MKSIRISHSMKQTFKDMDGTYDNAVNELIDTVEDYMPLVDLSDESSVIINLEDDTVDRINSFKLSKGESIENVLIRMLILSQVLNNDVE